MVIDGAKHHRDGNPSNRGRSSAQPHSESDNSLPLHIEHLHPDLQEVLHHAAHLQRLVPDAVLVGRSAASLYAEHRASFDHDHIVSDLRERFDIILEALEREEGWVTNRVRPGKIILGQIGDIEVGVRQLIRKRPLETTTVTLLSDDEIRVPTRNEILRIKAFLIVKRNQTRDYLDVAALSDKYGFDVAANVLLDIEDYYGDPDSPGELRSQLIRQLVNPQPKDSRTTKRLSSYKGLSQRWQNWEETMNVTASVAAIMEGSL